MSRRDLFKNMKNLTDPKLLSVSVYLCVFIYVYIYIYIYIHTQMSRFGMYLGSGVTVRCDSGTTGEKKKSTMLGFFSFILNRQQCKLKKST